MSTALVALAVLGAVLLGAYLIAVLERLVAAPGAWTRAFTVPLTDAARLMRQPALEPPRPDRFLFRSAPLIALASVGLAGLVVPIGPGLVGFDPEIGIFYFIVVLGPFVIAMMNAGWGANSKNGLLGAFRAAAHLVSYEVPLGFAAIGPAMAARSLSTVQIVEGQAELWYVVWQPLGFAIYLVSALFMTYRRPFDLPNAGSELEGGVWSELSGARLLLFRLSIDALFALLMAFGVVLFLGGWRGPWLPGPAWFALKTLALAALVLWAVRFFPRLRLDQMLGLAWKVLLPASLLNVIVVGVVILVFFGVGG